MSELTSADGTRIAYEVAGDGPALVLVDGALCSRAVGPSRRVARALADRFTVYAYDRRGRGESGDTQPYAVEREIEDLEAVVDVAGGSAHVCGISSGAQLALEAAVRSPRIARLALYELPCILDASRPPVEADIAERYEAALAAGRPGEPVEHFLGFVGVPAALIDRMRATPEWAELTALAPTLPYDARVMSEYQRGEPLPPGRWSEVAQPVLVLNGGRSPDWMGRNAAALAEAIPGAEHRVLDGQTHMVKARSLAPAVAEFLEMVDSGGAAA
jgi:pimeloyl-ACP methyl ester carboxylesterase